MTPISLDARGLSARPALVSGGRDGRPRLPVRFAAVAIWAAIALLALPLRAGSIVVWLGGSGNFEDKAKWDILRVPGNGDVLKVDLLKLVDSTVSIDSDAKVSDLFISSGDSLVVTNGGSLTLFSTGGVGTISNDGLLQLSSAGNATDLSLKNGVFTFSGTGSLTLSDNANNQIYGNSSTDELLNAAGHTIQGAGRLGLNLLKITNQGLIVANATHAFTLDPSSEGLTNTGTLRATNGGTLVLSSGTFTNSGGTIEARDASRVDVIGSTIAGGTLASAGTGYLRAYDNTTLSNLTIASGSTLELPNNERLNASGTLTNNGTVKLLSIGNFTDFIASGNVTLAGTGTLSLSDNTNNRILGASGAGTEQLINGAQHTIQGSGQIGANQMGLTNDGAVIANQATDLTIDPSAAGVTNNGTFRATGNATLNLIAGTFTNTGTIEALTGSTVRFENATVNGGTLASAGTGHLLHAGGSTFTDVTLLGGSVFDVDNATGATFGGTFNNQGNVRLNSVGNFTDFIVSSSGLTLTGGGTITFSNQINNRILGATATATLINLDNTILGSGQIGANQMQLENRGLVDANIGGSSLVIDPSGKGAINVGTLQATHGGILELQNGAFDNMGGFVRAQADSTVRLESATVNGGTLEVAAGGTLTLSNSTINGGTLNGSGTGSIATIGGSNTLGGAVTINPDTQLTVGNNTNLKLLASGTFVHDGVLTLASFGNFADLIIDGGDVVLDGHGTIAMGENSNNRILGSSADARLVLHSGLTLRGGGQVGVGLMGLTNAGIVEASQPKTPLVLDPNALGVANTGTLRATAGATLNVTNGSYDNAGGRVEAQDNSRVRFESAAVTGGTFVTSGSGRLVNAANSSFAGITLAGGSVFDIDNNTSATMSGTFANNGTVYLNSIGNVTDLIVAPGGLTLDGGGVISLGDNLNNRIYGDSASGTPTLVNQNNTIRGTGQIGVNLLAIDNRGTIEANRPSNTLQLDASVANTGTLQAVNGGLLRIESSTIDNTSGTIRADANSTVELASATITGGTLATAGNGVIRTAAGTNTLGGSLTLGAGSLVALDNSTSLTLLASGLYENQGTLELRSVGNLTDLRVSGGDVTVTGSGAIVLGDNSNNRILGNGGKDRLVNASGHTIRGSGQIGVGLMGVLNQGAIVANQPTPLTLDPSAAGFANTGRLRAEAGATLRLQSGAFNNTGGTIEAIGKGAVVEFNTVTVGHGLLTSGSDAVLRNVGNSTFADVTLSPGSTFEVPNNTLVHFSDTFVNNGVVSLQSVGNFTDFVVDGDLTLDGGGTIALGNNSANRIYGAVATNTLINKNNALIGSGSIGYGLMGLDNQATIRANQATPLVLAPSSAGVKNTGLLRADSGATLQLQNGVFSNNGGTIEAFGKGAVVQFSGATINRGLLQSADGGVLRNAGGSVFTDVTLSGGSTLEIPNALSATFSGTLTNNGVVQLLSAGNLTDLLVGSGGLTLVGGAIELNANSNNRIFSPDGTATLINESATIRGAGQLGVGLTKIENHSVVDANLAGATLTIDPNANGFVNTGVLTASNGGILRLRGGTYANTGGSISPGTGSQIELEAATISGGTLGGSTIRNVGGSTLAGMSISGGTTLEIPNATALTLTGAIANSGLVQLQSVGNATDLVIGAGGVTLSGHGTIELGDNGGNRVYGTTGATTLNNVDNVIRGSGQLGSNQLTLTNTGTIEANRATPLTVNLSNANVFTNGGTLRATNGGQLIFTDNLANAAIVSVQAGSAFTGEGTYTQTGGATILDGGTLTATSHTFQPGGVLQGSGTVNGPVSNRGIIAPGATLKSSGIGQLTFNATLTLTPTSLLHLELGGAKDFDRIQAPAIALDGSLLIAFANGFQSTIQSTDTFTLLATTNANGLTGAFDGFANGSRIFTADGFGSFQVNYLANSFTLSNFAAVPEPSTYALLTLGAAVVLILDRRRRKG